MVPVHAAAIHRRRSLAARVLVAHRRSGAWGGDPRGLGSVTPRTVILVPRRDGNPERDAVWAWVRAWWSREFPDLPIVEGHHDTGLFNRSAALNIASRLAGEWLAGTRTGSNGVTLICSYKDFALSDMVHCYFQDTGHWALQLRVAGGAFVGLLSGDTAAPTFGQPYPIGLRISGSVITVELLDGTEESVDDPRTDMWGRLLTYQTGWDGTTGAHPGFLSLGAEGVRPPNTGLVF